ncbi:MAG: VWA domain-containing protein [Chlamydiae bacterium]|nr:VWA domain-containing protein [Chlamydiota bacterium]MBI3267174.1 VWA domain-containing protein [Chlamydiota bacterium]
MRFANAWVLYLIWMLIPILFIFWRDSYQRKKILSKWGGVKTIERLTPSLSLKKRRARKILEILGLLFILLALARPQGGKKERVLQGKGLEIVIAVDTSTSMLAEDYPPNRLSKAKQELTELVEKLNGNRMALVAFAGVPVTLCPLTLDTSALKVYLDILDTQLIGIQGTGIGRALRHALTLFDKNKSHDRLIVLLTDGEDHETDLVTALKEAVAMGVKIYTIGIGASSGEPIPLLDEKGQKAGHKRDEKGEIVLTHLDEKTLQEIANVTGGTYYRASRAEGEVKYILRDVQKMEKGLFGQKNVVQYEEKFQIPLLIGFILWLMAECLGERREQWRSLKDRIFKGEVRTLS